jgi:PBP1b-binding outer membrane lipoprotein LpoB
MKKNLMIAMIFLMSLALVLTGCSSGSTPANSPRPSGKSL